MTKLLVPGLTCGKLMTAPHSGLLVDGRDFYKAVYDACCKAERTIMMAGWQFETEVELVRGEDADGCEHPPQLIPFLRSLCEHKPDLQVYILAWDASPVFVFEREPLQRWKFRRHGHERIHYKMDNAHPTGASHHQKMIIVDRAIAFTGGMDVCNSRWDDRDHAAEQPLRCSRNKPYQPYHDVQAFVTGDAVDVLHDWFCERWKLATDIDIECNGQPREPIAIRPTLEIDAPCLGLMRTLPRMDEPHVAPVKEMYDLHLRAIQAAERYIYIENQYFSSDEIAHAIETRMAATDHPLEIVLVLPEKSAGWKERITIGVYQQRLLERLTKCAEATGSKLGVYYHCACGKAGEIPVFIHAKVLAVDDRFLLVSSANTTNRSMGFDTELGVAWEDSVENASIRHARMELMAEHAGLEGDELEAVLGDPAGLVDRLDELARAKQHKLRIHRRNQDERPGPVLAKLLPDETPFDPDDPQSMEELLPEPGVWLDRLFRDPLWMLKRSTRTFGRRVRHKLRTG
ncbi:MAG TPA: phospholipase D-like domain-containing protein [Kofleriaceae bacterium]|nr:phospholipase D-like domain-containing protein [Kofleriaceae bacterium]